LLEKHGFLTLRCSAPSLQLRRCRVATIIFLQHRVIPGEAAAAAVLAGAPTIYNGKLVRGGTAALVVSFQLDGC